MHLFIHQTGTKCLLYVKPRLAAFESQHASLWERCVSFRMWVLSNRNYNLDQLSRENGCGKDIGVDHSQNQTVDGLALGKEGAWAAPSSCSLYPQ